MLTVACVRTGTKYSVDYVHRLRAMVARHLDRPHRFVVLTDRPEDLSGVETIDAYAHHALPSWWTKMCLFSPDWRDGRALYFDLDTVIAGDLGPLADLECEFGICENFTRLAGHTAWPCKYGSCAMVFGQGWGDHVWQAFKADAINWMTVSGRYGDQMAIEHLVSPGEVTLLQSVLPPGFFLGYRDLPKHAEPPRGCSVVVFAGAHKPSNTNCDWARAAWAA